MGNQPTKQSGRPKKAVHWKSAEPPSPPGKPMLVPGTPNEAAPDVVTLRWKRPLSDGGSPILGYIIEHRRTGSPHWVRATAQLIQATELSFSGLEPGWRYQFRVVAQNIVGQSDSSELSDALTVTLQRAAMSPPRFVYDLIDITAIEDEKIEFRVAVAGTPAPQINWFKDGFEMFSSRRTKISAEGDYSVLVIHQAALTDEGEIKCTATNRAGYAVTTCNLSIDAYPKIRLPRQYEDGLIIEAEEVIRLKVGLAGHPTPFVEWSHNGELLTSGGRYEIETSDKNSSLRIANAQRSDRGEYNLRAFNKLGEDYASFLVTVTAKPEPPGKITVSKTFGKSVTLSWAEPEDDGGCKIGNYIVEYYRLGWDVWLKASTCRQLNTTLSGLIEGSRYRFRVKAENPYGLSEPSEESDTVFIPDPKRGINSSTQFPDVEDIDNQPPQQQPLSVPRKRREESRSPAREAEQVKKAKAFIPETYSRDEIVREMSYGTRDEDFFRPKPAELPTREPSPAPPVVVVPSVTYSRDENVREKSYGTRDEDFFRPKPPEPTKEPSPVPPVVVVPSVVVTEPVPLEVAPPTPQTPPQRPTSFTSPLKAMERFSKDPSPLASIKTSSENSLFASSPPQLPSPTSPTPSDKPTIHNSSEFMLVLYNEQQAKNNTRNSTFDFELEDMVAPPPPLSLSAPELNVEPPPIPAMRPAVSSTELLYERAMARFYQAVAMEESENQRKEAERRRSSFGGAVEPFQPQQNGTASQDPAAVASRLADRRSSLRRRLSGDKETIVKQSSFESDGRPVSMAFDDVIPEEKEELVVAQTVLEEVQEEVEVLEELLPPVLEEIQEEVEALEELLPPVEEAIEELDEEGSISSSMNSLMEELKRRESTINSRSRVMSDEDEEMETYHPGERLMSPYRNPDPSQAIEVLTKPLPMPDPNFVPKPILKRPSTEILTKDEKDKREIVPKEEPEKKIIPSKPERKSLMNFAERESPTKDELPKQQQELSLDREKTPEIKVNQPEIPVLTPPLSEKQGPSEKEIESAIVQEASRQKRQETRKTSVEESRAVADFYGDILERVENSKKPRKLPLYMGQRERSRETSYDRFTQSRSGSQSPLPVDEIYRPRKSRSPSLASEQLVTKGKPARESKILRQRSASIETEPSRPPSALAKEAPPPPALAKEAPPPPALAKEAPPPPAPQKVTTPAPTHQLESAFIPSAYDEPIRKSRAMRESSAIAKKRNISKTRSRSSSAARDAESITPAPKAAPLATTLPSRPPPSKTPEPQSRPTTPSGPPTTAAPKEVLAPEARSRSQSRTREPTPQQTAFKYTLSYLTDVALFAIACWLYLFKNPKWAIPVLTLIMYRHISEAVQGRIPPWVKRSLGRDS